MDVKIKICKRLHAIVMRRRLKTFLMTWATMHVAVDMAHLLHVIQICTIHVTLVIIIIIIIIIIVTADSLLLISVVSV